MHYSIQVGKYSFTRVTAALEKPTWDVLWLQLDYMRFLSRGKATDHFFILVHVHAHSLQKYSKFEAINNVIVDL